jgi:large subunit ribosomal protein L25
MENNMATVNLDASIRKGTGKGVARKIRRTGLVPATIYAGGIEPTLVTINPLELTLAFQRTGDPNTLVDIKTDDGVQKSCLVKEVQRHPVSGAIRHVDFYNVDSNKEIVVHVPVRTTGRAVGIQMGGTLRVIIRTLAVRCLPANIPSSIDIDVTDLDIAKFIRVSDLPQSDTHSFVFKSDFNVLTVMKKRG